MNCEKFENRVQQLLDSRTSLTLDLAIQKHARDCETCQSALAIYECLSDFGPIGDDSASESDSYSSEPVLLASHSGTSKEWQDRQRSTTRNRLIVAVAALVFLTSFLVNRQADSPLETVAAINDDLLPVVDHQIETPATTTMLSQSFGQLSGIWNYVVPDDLSDISPTSYIDISSLRQIDFVALMPEDQVRAVRNLPATLESMHPIYRYSTEVPVLKNWSNGINCTLGVIQSSLSPSPRQKSLVLPSGNDVGIRSLKDNRNIC